MNKQTATELQETLGFSRAHYMEAFARQDLRGMAYWQKLIRQTADKIKAVEHEQNNRIS